MTIIYQKESYAIIGACFEVYKEKGCGFLEPVYQECLEIELEIQGISFKSQSNLNLEYKGRILKHRYVPDFICFDKIILEIKERGRINFRKQAHRFGSNLFDLKAQKLKE